LASHAIEFLFQYLTPSLCDFAPSRETIVFTQRREDAKGTIFRDGVRGRQGKYWVVGVSLFQYLTPSLCGFAASRETIVFTQRREDAKGTTFRDGVRGRQGKYWVVGVSPFGGLNIFSSRLCGFARDNFFSRKDAKTQRESRVALAGFTNASQCPKGNTPFGLMDRPNESY
jgi:hypothetical protein